MSLYIITLWLLTSFNICIFICNLYIYRNTPCTVRKRKDPSTPAQLESETPAKRQKRLTYLSNYQSAQLNSETPLQCQTRLLNKCIHEAARLNMETPQDRKERLLTKSTYQAAKRAMASPEERQKQSLDISACRTLRLQCQSKQEQQQRQTRDAMSKQRQVLFLHKIDLHACFT